jgi:hypothetical protein
VSEAILEEMRERLAEKGAFDRFKKKKEECGEIDMKMAHLKKSMEEREKEPFLEVEPIDRILSDVEAKDLSMFFTKKEIDDLINKKYPMIKTSATIRNIIINLSQLGVSPKKPHRLIGCMKCGTVKEFMVDLCAFWELQKKYYCENCKKEIEALNKPKNLQIPLIPKHKL